jgi:hypothetical protein
MPVHPLKGFKLDILRARRDHLARRQTFIAELPGGAHIVLPVEWTDRGPPWVTPTIDGKEVRLSARGLLALARAVDTALRQKLDNCPQSSPASTQAEYASKNVDVSSRGRDRGVDGTDADDAARSAGGVGKPSAQDALPKRGRR